MSAPLQVPELPRPGKLIPLKDAIKQGMVAPFSAHLISSALLQRWCTRGVRLTPSGPHYWFPSVKGSRERLTCAEWCAHWNAFVEMVQREDAERQVEAAAEVKADVTADRRAEAAMDRFRRTAANGAAHKT